MSVVSTMRLGSGAGIENFGASRFMRVVLTHRRFKGLEGLTIGPGFQVAVCVRVGGVQGCAHLVELLDPIATTVCQTMTVRRSHRKEQVQAESGPERPRFLGTCHALATDSPVVKDQWPEFYTGGD